jgi:hypothetical protein
MPVTSKGYARTGPPLWKRADHPDSTPAAAPFCEKWSVRVPEFFSARVPPIRVRQIPDVPVRKPPGLQKFYRIARSH